jgi:hypothetical protein
MAPDARRSLAGANVATLTPHRQRPEGCNPRLCTARWQDRSPHERSDMRGPAPAPDVASLIRATFPALAPGTRACSRFGFQTAASSSLRANGSRERAPDDRLREAIHASTRGRMDCFVAYAPRNDDEVRVSSPAARSARALQIHTPIETEGAGNAGCWPHPQPCVQR